VQHYITINLIINVFFGLIFLDVLSSNFLLLFLVILLYFSAITVIWFLGGTVVYIVTTQGADHKFTIAHPLMYFNHPTAAARHVTLPE